MKKTYIGYMNNFPREDAVKGQKFEGDKTLKDELTGRKIIGEIEEVQATIVLNSAAKIKELQEELKSLKDSGDNELLEELEKLENSNKELETKVTTLEDENKKALEVANAKIEELHGFVDAAISLAKGTTPEGYTKDS